MWENDTLFKFDAVKSSQKNCSDSRLLADHPGYQDSSFLLNGISTLIFVVVGSVGNIYSLLLFRKSNLRKQAVCASLSCLSIWDTVLLLSALAYYCLGALITPWVTSNYPIFALISAAFHPIISICYTASAWFYVAITVQRYLAVMRPFINMPSILQMEPLRSGSASSSSLTRSSRFSAISLLSRNQAIEEHFCVKFLREYRIPIIVSLSAIAIRIPTFFEVRTGLCLNVLNGKIGAQIIPTEMRLHSRYKLGYRVLTGMLFTTGGPFLIVLCFTVAILRHLHAAYRNGTYRMARRQSKAVARDARKELYTTVILVALMFKFLLCRTLPIVMDIWESVIGYKGHRIKFQCLVDISNFLVVVGSASNGIIYAIGRKILKSKSIFKLYRQRYRKKRPGFNAEELARLEFSWVDIWCGKTPALGESADTGQFVTK